jgi:hypothetical protein
MADRTSTSKPGGRWPVRLGCTLLLVALVAGYTDYAVFHARKRQAIAVVAELGGRAGSIGGWPLGEENRIEFRRSLDDDELQRLAILNSLPRRNWVGVAFIDCDLSEARIEEIRGILWRCHVFCWKSK